MSLRYNEAQNITWRMNGDRGDRLTDFLFDFIINDWDTWGKIYCSTDDFEPLIKRIFNKETLVFHPVENCKPGTNGIFRVGPYVIKIFVPIESGYDSWPDYRAELFALERANTLGVSVPRLLAKGEIQDRYLFRYLIMDYIEGETLGDRKASLSSGEKNAIGSKLRQIVQRWATPCENFNGVDVIKRALGSQRWNDAPADIKEEQKRYLSELDGDSFVYVHGDLTEDNLIIGNRGEVAVIDFADSVRAPAIYEEMTIICDAFSFDIDFLNGYYGRMAPAELLERCVQAILCHEYGYHVVKNLFGSVYSLADLKSRIISRLTTR